MRNLFHSPSVLSALTSGSLPGEPLSLFQSPPEPLSWPRPRGSPFRRIPNLHLRHAAQVDAAVAVGQGLVFHQELDVAVVFVGGEVEPLPSLTISPFSIRQWALIGRGLACRRGRRLRWIAFVFGELFRGHGEEFARVSRAPAKPAGEVLAIGERGKARRRRVLREAGDSSAVQAMV